MNDELNNSIIDAFSKVMRTMKHTFFLRSKTSHVTMLQFEALSCILKMRKAHMGDIAEHFSTTMPTATSLIDKLIETDLVKRKNDRDDRRVVEIKLTYKGKQLLKDMARQRENKISHLLSFISKKDKLELLRILEILAKKSEEL